MTFKVICDKCGKEITDHANVVPKRATDGRGVVLFDCGTDLYCDECMKDDLTYGFKVGDQVITSTGQVGKIIDICTCDSCKERGFYEPKVEVEIGSEKIYITDNDKRVNFRSFYKIGDKVFGNIDEKDLLYAIESTKEAIRKLQLKLIDFEAQLLVVQKLKNKNN